MSANNFVNKVFGGGSASPQTPDEQSPTGATSLLATPPQTNKLKTPPNPPPLGTSPLGAEGDNTLQTMTPAMGQTRKNPAPINSPILQQPGLAGRTLLGK